ncbi:hypothetical protein QFW05_001001 [Escherichia coli]|nr:hypothetical protein [Escherichia coli]
MIIVIPVKGGEYITGFRGCSLPPQIEDCGRINGLVLLSQHPPMGVFETINSLGLLPRSPQIEVAGNINGLGHSAILHSGTIPTSYRSGPPANAILRFALISVSYRANFRSLWKLGRINGLGWFPRCSPLANFENINKLPLYPDMGITISGLDTWLFFRLTVDQAGGLYIPLITIMMIQVRTFSPVG